MKLKKTLLSVVACMLSFVIAFAFAACGKDKVEDPNVTAITVEPTSKEMDQGDSFTLAVTATYDNGTTGRLLARDGVTFESSAEAVASVTSNGLVKAVDKGTATITAKLDEFTATCEVTVHSLALELSETSLRIEKDATATLTATVTRDGTVLTGDDAKVEWSSSAENVASVKDGVITAKSVGTATITATKGGQTATCAVEVYWEEPVGYNPIAWAEQNKLTANTWGYWNSQDPNWANGGLATDYVVYTDETFVESASTLKEGYDYIGMGRITFEYEITNPGPNWTYQAFYRSSDNVEGGKLAYNHDYELTFKMVANKSGDVTVNPYDDVRGQNADESEDDYNAYLAEREATGKYNPNHTFTLEANVEQQITVVFRHDDCGYVYQQGIYDNMGSALHLQLGDITDGKVVLSVWDFQFKDLGAADYPVADDESKHAEYVDPSVPGELPTHPAAPEVKPAAASTATKAYLSAEDNKAVFNIEGTLDLSYFNNSVDEAKTWLLATHFDGQQSGGNWTEYAFNRIDATVSADGTFLIKYDITYLGVDRGGSGAYTCHFTEKEAHEDGYGDNKYRDLKLDEEHAVPGQAVTVGNKTYSIVNIVGGSTQQQNWGCVSIKVESNGSTTEPETSAINDYVKLVVEGDKLYYVVITETEVTAETVKFNLQGNPYVSTGDWGGDWTCYTFEGIEVAQEGGKYLVKIDITSLINREFDYTSHLSLGADPSMNAGIEPDQGGPEDFKLTISGTQTVTFNGYTVKLVSVANSGDGAEYWGCVGLNVRLEGAVSVNPTAVTLETDAAGVYYVVTLTATGCTKDDLQANLSYGDNAGQFTVSKIEEVDGGYKVYFNVISAPGEGAWVWSHLYYNGTPYNGTNGDIKTGGSANGISVTGPDGRTYRIQNDGETWDMDVLVVEG